MAVRSRRTGRRRSRAWRSATSRRPCRPARARAALIGAGVQGHSHLAVLGRVLPGVALTLFDRHPERAEALAEAARETDGIGEVTLAPDARAAVRDADVVVTAASFGPVRQVMTGDWLAADALVVPVDYATYLAAEVARDAALFLVDDRGQFLANRDAGLFDGYPDPTATIGEAILAGTAAAGGRPGRRDASRGRPGGRRLRSRDRPTRGGARPRDDAPALRRRGSARTPRGHATRDVTPGHTNGRPGRHRRG